MYRVYCDDFLIFSKNIPTLQLTDAKLELELNKTGMFTFTIYPNHKYYDKLVKMKSIIRVYQADKLLFKGRILNEELSFYNAKQVTCEGVLAFLLDSIIRPFNFSEGVSRKTPKELLEYFIHEHNKNVDEYKKFKVGNVTVTNDDTTNTDAKISRMSNTYQTTWNAIQSNLIEELGGYLYVRYESDGTYIDYLKDFDVLSNQPIIFGRNLLDLTRNIKGENVITAIIPTGGSEDSLIKLNYGSTPKNIGNGYFGKEDYIYNEISVKKYGWITTYSNWNDITNVDNLETKAIKFLDNGSKYLTAIEIKAIDLSLVNVNYDSFSLGQKIIIKSKYHMNNDKTYLLDKLSIDLLNPENSTLMISSEYRNEITNSSFIDQNNKVTKNSNKLVGIVSSNTSINSANINDLRVSVDNTLNDLIELRLSIDNVKSDTMSNSTKINELKELLTNLTKRVDKLEENKV